MNQGNMLSFQGLSRLIRILESLGILLAFLLFVLLYSCERGTTDEPDIAKSGIRVHFDHSIADQPLQFDTLIYQNEAGNDYLVNEIQYFISDIILYHEEKGAYMIDEWKAIHYVDTDIESSRTWEVYDDLSVGNYDSIHFTFGVSEARNISFMYVNAPEKDMFWPEFLGGGYHYLKLNGKWLTEDQLIQTTPFNFHLGIGQLYHSYPDSISGFVHNYFHVSLPASGFSLSAGEIKDLKLTMHVENWFRGPHIYDHDVYGGYIMQNQDAMQRVKENGHNVFTFEEITNEE